MYKIYWVFCRVPKGKGTENFNHQSVFMVQFFVRIFNCVKLCKFFLALAKTFHTALN